MNKPACGCGKRLEEVGSGERQGGGGRGKKGKTKTWPTMGEGGGWRGGKIRSELKGT